MNREFQNSVVLITSQEPKNSQFGTGFAIRQNLDAIYILTCAHVITAVGGSGSVKVGDFPTKVIASGEDKGIDLAILKVEGLWYMHPLALRPGGEKGDRFVSAGFQLFGRDRLIRPIHGILDNQVKLQTLESGNLVLAWDLIINDDHTLQHGYSGSPVLDEKSGDVIGIISHSQRAGKNGLAISTDALKQFWSFIDSDQLYRNLLRLGYLKQSKLFNELIKNHSIGGVLIHGLPGYGQRWLLNRLVERFVPNRRNYMPVIINFKRKSLGTDIDTLWRRLARQTGLKRELNPSPEIVVDRVYRWCETRNVLVVFHEVNYLSENSLKELINDFWTPLSHRLRTAQSQTCQYKLLMFLVDYEGHTESWNIPLIEKLDLSQDLKFPVKSPKLQEFSQLELEDWIYREFDLLPTELTSAVDDAVEDILQSSEGIPEQVLEDICDYCGCDWYEIEEKWMRL